MSPHHPVPLRAAPVPAGLRDARSTVFRFPRSLPRACLALLLVLGLLPGLLSARLEPAVAAESFRVNVVLHFKDTALRTIDFASYEAAAQQRNDSFIVDVGQQNPACSFDDHLRFAVYDYYATFNNKQIDLTEQCTYDASSGEVRIPAALVPSPETLAVVFWLAPTHPAYEHFVLADLDTSDAIVSSGTSELRFRSDVPDAIREAKCADSASSTGPLKRLAAGFPGTLDKHYQLNSHTRLENFDIDMKKKQAAYGFPSAMIGSYGFGAFFGTRQVYEGGVSTGTTWDEPVLKPSSSTYNEAVDAFFGDTIAGRLGKNAEFATARNGTEYRTRYLTTGSSYQDPGYGPGEAPNNKAMAHGTCGSSGVVNGGGAIIMDSAGDNYLAFKGTYKGSQSAYTGWLKFFYKFDAKSASTGQSFQDVVGYLLVPPPNQGKAQAIKKSANQALSNANSRYSLKHAVIAAFADKSDAEAAAAKGKRGTWDTWQEARDWARTHTNLVFVSKDDGKSNIVAEVEAGTYYAAELFAPSGFRRYDGVKKLTIEARADDENPDTVTFVDEPQRGAIDLVKVSDNPRLTDGNPCYSLANATYGVFTDAACLNRYGTMDVAPNDKGAMVARIDEVPIGSYWVRETKRAAKGYAVDPRIYPVTVVDGETFHVNKGAVPEPPKLEPLDILLRKVDRRTGKPVPQGGANLGDAHFRINYYPLEGASAATLATAQPQASWVVRTNDEGAFSLKQAEGTFTHRSQRGPEQVLPYKVSGPDFYKLQDGTLGLPIGSYTIQEVKAPEGYLPDTTVHVRHVSDENHDRETLENFQAEEGGDRISDVVVRSDLRFIKRANGSTRLAGVPFKITARSTGEWHILVTDKNGFASTEASASRPHTSRTNANDAQFRDAEGRFSLPLSVDMSQLDANAGCWFSGGASEGASPADNEGALPYDLYDIEELRCPANQLFSMIRDEVIVDAVDQGKVIDLGTLNNTTYNKPRIRTHAYNGATGNLFDSQLNAEDEAVIMDRVSYEGLEPGQEYTLEAVLMDRATGEPFLADGETVSATVAFVPKESNGFVTVPLTFDASSVTEETAVVVFETLKRGETEEASHRHMDDLKQTVTISPVALHTNAHDQASGTHGGSLGDPTTIVDVVAYRGLTPGRTYTMTAVLMNRATQKPFTVDGQVVSADRTFTPEDSQGTIAMELTFTPPANGDFTASDDPGTDGDDSGDNTQPGPDAGADNDPDAEPGAEPDDENGTGTEPDDEDADRTKELPLVVFESLYYNDKEIALHADLDNQDQTVVYPLPEEPEEPEEPSVPEEPEEVLPPDEPAPLPEEPPAPESPEPQEPPTEVEETPAKPTEVKEKPRPFAALSQTSDNLGRATAALVVVVLGAASTLVIVRRRQRS